MGSEAVVEALAAQLTLAADRVECQEYKEAIFNRTLAVLWLFFQESQGTFRDSNSVQSTCCGPWLI